MPAAKPEMIRLLAASRDQRPFALALLESLVRLESPSTQKPAVDRVARLLARQWMRAGAALRLFPQRNRGDHLRATIPATSASRSRAQLLVLGHMDTVYPLGTLAAMPWRVSRGCAYGPGTFDMKGGLVIALAAIRILAQLGKKPRRPVVFLWTSDEEIGSGSSRPLIEREARRSEAVLVLEPALGTEGRLKTRRKGVGGAQILVTGRAAHAGINPSEGLNALHELAHVILKIEAMNDLRRGITANATIASAGTFANVIPSEARASVDLRISRAEDAPRLARRLLSLQPVLPGARLQITGGIERPPLERSAGVRALFRHARGLAAEMGLILEEGSTGGGSDGNLTAALGIPTLDGLGAVGHGAHTPGEHIILSALSQRAALLAGLLLTL